MSSGSLRLGLVVATLALLWSVSPAIVAADDATDDHSETMADATLLTSSVDGEISPGTDADAFRIEVTEVAPWVTVYTTGDLDTKGLLVQGTDDESATLVAESGDGGDARNFRITRHLEPGTYYVGILSEGEEVGRYVVHLIASDRPEGSLDELAKTLLAGIMAKLPAGSRPEDISVGLRPLSVDPTGPSPLPDDVRDHLSERLLEAVLNADERITLQTRHLINEVYGTLREYANTVDLKKLLEAAGAEVEIFCNTELKAVESRINVSCTAELLTETETLAHADVDVPVERNRMFDVVIEDLAERIVRDLPQDGTLRAVRLSERGQRSELSEFMGNRLKSSVSERILRHENWGMWQAIGGDAGSDQSTRPEYVLSGELWCAADEGVVQLIVDVDDPEGDPPRLFGRSAQVPVDSLPSGLRCAAGASERRHEAVGATVMSEGLDRNAAERAARNLARARVIARGLGMSLPDVEVVSDERQAFAVVAPYLSRGLPVDEQELLLTPADRANGEDRAVVRLSARVVAVGTSGEVTAFLEDDHYEVDEPIRIQIESDRALHVGVFAWRGDERVIRLYPRDGERLQLEAEAKLVLPRPDESEITPGRLAVGGVKQRHEAIVVVAAPASMNYSVAAPVAGDDRGSPVGEFFAALSGLSLGDMTVVVLPYQVGVSEEDGRPEPKRDEIPSIGIGEQKYLFGMETANEARDYEKVVEYGDKLAALGGALPVEATYYQGVAYMELGRDEEADEVLTEYLAELPRTEDTAERFKEVLGRLLELESRMEADAAAYEEAEAVGTAESYGDYLREYPSGQHAEDARRLQGEAKDDEAYERAHTIGTAWWYEEYLRKYPTGRHAEEARRQLTDAKDDEAYRRATTAGTAAAYDEYLQENPHGRHADDARRIQATIQFDDAAYDRAKAAGTAGGLRRVPEGASRRATRR